MTPIAANEIRLMEQVCQLAAATLAHVAKFIKPGVTTNELDQIVYDFTLSHDAVPAPLNYNGFPKSICTSVNACICHGVPDNIPLREGDMLNVDVTSVKQGFFGDTSATYFVGEVSDRAKKLTEVAEQAMLKGIEVVRPFGTTGDIGFAINKYVTKKGYFPVKEIGGHGIGKKFHTDPFVPSYGKKGRGEKLVPFTCITVEPMINETDAPIKEMSIPNSSIKYYETGDGTLSAQFEHTILITDKRYEILTSLD
ncbi:MAG: type I methionyl aminopeptidase [Bdellovibrionaceae bacterium]|nr:type I methionyl aminopeptidase [Bdellovibrionales bacterium]MCB9083135.1 type I methionyl aminopeptidase [Pseudobdellovibrionaceae bacterium]